MHTVELLPDERVDHGVRAMWDRLLAAGLKSLATHPHPSNRPHLTVVSAPALDGLAPPALPVAAELGPVRLLGRALVREVTPTEQLRDLQAQVWSALTGAWPPPQEWVPHVSLALNVPAGQREAALALFAGEPTLAGSFVAARSYDSQTRDVVEVAARGVTGLGGAAGHRPG